jgi:hypothetical protein
VLLVAATAAGALAMALARRCRRVPLAPSIMVGYSLAAVVGAAAPHLFGGGFR